MAREKKPIELRVVDDESADKRAVIRLGEDFQPVRLVPEIEDNRKVPAARLEPPVADDQEPRRTHEPGVEVLLETEGANLATIEENWEKSPVTRNPIPWGWFALLGILLTGAVTWSVSNVKQADVYIAEEHQQAVAAAREAEDSDREMELLFEKMSRTVKAFCEAGSLKTMLPMVRQRERVEPIMKQYYETHPIQPMGFKRIKTFHGTVLDNNSNFWVYSVVPSDGKAKNILLEQVASGEVLVDWETAVNYQPMNWDEYAVTRPQGTVMDFRVYADEDFFFSHEFANSNQWASFKLTALDSQETLFGYAPKEGEVASFLSTIIQQTGRKHVPVILRLSLPPGLQSRRGVVIEKVVNPRWIYVVPPDSGS